MLTVPYIVLGSAFLAVTAVFILVFVWFWRFVIRHRSDIKQGLNCFLPQRIHSLLLSFEPLCTFIEARLSPRGFFGLHFTLGATVVIGAGFLFYIIAENVVNGGTLTIVDAQIAQWLHAHSTPLLTQCLLILTHLHDPITISFMVALIAFYLIWKRRWYDVLAVLLVVPGGMLLNLLVKQVFQRTRPSFENPLITLTTYSFPSGHVAASTLFYGMLATLLISQTPTCSRATCMLLISLIMIALVAFSRMYLGAHYLSDVLSAFLEGIAWLTLCLTSIHSYRVYHETKIR
jgi:membrane-associated phospholipid phosphatase